MKIYWGTRLRGFLKHVSECVEDVEFIQKSQFYEISNKKSDLKSRLIRSTAFDLIGLFQTIKISGKDCDCYGSFNRFLDCDKPYFIYLENPTALYHYALNRLRYPSGKNKFKKHLYDPNLKYIVCMSEACCSTFEKINMPLPEGLKIKTIYPLVPQNLKINEELIERKSYDEVLKCLYCVQGKSFYTKGGRDILEAVTNLQDKGCKIQLTIITNPDALQEDTLKLIESREDLTLHDFSFSYEELESIYAETAVLLQPSSADSFGLTVLEAMKGGCAVLGSKLYAFPEMIEDGENGVLIDPLYWTFTPENYPNPVAWGHHRKVRLSEKRSQKYVDDIENALKSLYSDRDKLCAFSKKSLEIANSKFSEETICEQWKEVWDSLKGK
ncbi:MAG: glycosyltransferase family 4 protein [Clostridia bacterium]|nr:glycosyltransferase family 4 protein [Clostridia bacterium]